MSNKDKHPPLENPGEEFNPVESTARLTDTEIIKALECCNRPANQTSCDDCPYQFIDEKCSSKLINDAIDLINRKQAENSNLTSDLTSLQNDLTSAKAEIERLTTLSELGKMRANDYRVMRDRALKAEKELEEQQAEIERLQEENKILSSNADNAFQEGLNESRELFKQEVEVEIKTEAVKAFAERLKEKQFCFGSLKGVELVSVYAVELKDIDNLVKEMVGEDK